MFCYVLLIKGPVSHRDKAKRQNSILSFLDTGICDKIFLPVHEKYI